MASIIKRGSKYRALIRKKGITRCQTFQSKAAAKAWAIRIEAEMELVATGSRLSVKGLTMGDLIDRYTADIEPIKKWSLNKRYTLNMLKTQLGDRPASSFGVNMVLMFANDRRAGGVGAAAIKGNLSYLGTVVKYARNTLMLDIDVNVVSEALSSLSDNGLLCIPRHRERRPTEAELELLRSYFDTRNIKLPMSDITNFAISSGMRRCEICSIKWVDLDTRKKLVIIRNRKHPSRKIGNDQTVPLLGSSFDIAVRQPRVDERIFPYIPMSVTETFIRACRMMKIEDLHFHDLRHHALSLLFEQGFLIPEVAIVSGHSSWDMLKRYTHIKPESLHR